MTFTYFRLSAPNEIFKFGHMFTFYLLTDQPTTCPICGTRTEMLADFLHTSNLLVVERCLNSRCKYVFLEVEK